MDINGDFQPDFGTEPIGFYGGVTPTPIHLANGSDALGIVIVMQDPPAASATNAPAARTAAWPAVKQPPAWLQKISAALQQQKH